jgi:hypothetical protein
MDVRGPARYLWWLAGQRKGRVLLGAMFGSLWFASLAFMPYLLSQAIDRGLAPRRSGVPGTARERRGVTTKRTSNGQACRYAVCGRNRCSRRGT